MTAKADRIEALVNDPDLVEAFDDVRETLRDCIEDTPLNDTEMLLDFHRCLRCLTLVENSLQRAIEDGHLEDFRAQEKERMQGWQKEQRKMH